MSLISRLPKGLRILHWVIIVNFLINIIYGTYQIFFVLRPEGAGFGPLGDAAKTMDPNMMMARRLYASEVWITIVGLCLYLALTLYLPRLIAMAKTESVSSISE